MSFPSVENDLIICGIGVLLLILLFLFIINFINHFQFNYKCPLIIRDLEVAGIYPTLTQVYIVICFIILIFVIISKLFDSTYISHPIFIEYSSCYTQFKLYTNTIFTTQFISKNGMDSTITLICRLFIILQLFIIYILETYFSFSRYYNVCDITHKYHLSIPFTIYSIIFMLLSWLSITILPILILFLSIFHILNIAYFSYYFHYTIQESYKHIFDSPDFGQFGHNDTYTAMKMQLKQIHTMSILSTISSFITSYNNYSYISCSNNNIEIVSILLIINCILLFCQFTKNRIFIKHIFKCKCLEIYNICHMPCDMIIERRIKRKWIRKRQKSIFDRLQSININRPTIPTINWNWSKQNNNNNININKPTIAIHKPPLHAHSLNNSVDRSNMVSNDMSIDILDLDIDPHNQILENQIENNENDNSIINLHNPFHNTNYNINYNTHTASSSEIPENISTFKQMPSNSDTIIHTARPSLSLQSQTDSMRSDISNIFIKMKSIGKTFRDKPRQSNIDLVKELAQQIEMANGKELKDLKREANLLKMKQKTNKQISFGADMALEIIKETINTKENKNKNKKLDILKQNESQKQPKLMDCSSEPPLISKEIYINNNSDKNIKTPKEIIKKRMKNNLNLKTQKKSKSNPLQELNENEEELNTNENEEKLNEINDHKRSKTVPNSPKEMNQIKEMIIQTQSDPICENNYNHKNKNNIQSNIEKKTVFLYDNSAGNSKETNISNFDHLTRTQSLIEIPKELIDSPKKELNISPIQTSMDIEMEMEDGSYIVYDFYNYNAATNRDDIKTPLTPTSTKTPQIISNTPFDNSNSNININNNNNNNNNGGLVLKKLNVNTERSKTKSIMGTLRGMLNSTLRGGNNTVTISPSDDNNHSITKSISTSKLHKINSFLKQNGMTMHHQNVNEVFRNMRFTKRNELEIIDSNNEINQNHNINNINNIPNNNKHKKQSTDIMETIVEN